MMLLLLSITSVKCCILATRPHYVNTEWISRFMVVDQCIIVVFICPGYKLVRPCAQRTVQDSYNGSEMGYLLVSMV